MTDLASDIGHRASDFIEMNIAVIKYNSGNVQSVLYALERLGADAELTDDPEKILNADKVIFLVREKRVPR